jgi:hypothetical protein
MTAISPRLRLIDLCGPGHLFNSRVPDNAAAWVFESAAVADASTGNQLTVLGNMPVLCSAGVATENGLGLLRELGFELEAELVTFTDAADRMDKLRELAQRDLIFIDQHAQPQASLQPGESWVDPALLSSLNNKRNLSRWVPAELVPQRENCALAALDHLKTAPGRFPLLLKAVTDSSCGSGKGVLLLRAASEVDAAREFFAACDSVIIEEYLDMTRNLCVNFAVFDDGRIEYLGAAQQIISDGLRYLGNWLEPAGAEPAALIEAGIDIMRNACRHGYRGFAGFDAAVGTDGRFHIYDLNFRFNGSTAPLLLYDSLAARLGLPVAKYGAWKYKGGFDEMMPRLRIAIERYQLMPFGMFDPSRCGVAYEPVPRISAMLFGSSREEVAENEKRLAALGFY